MNYFQRYVKIMPTSNKKNYPLSKLLFNYTGDEYEPLNFKGLYNDFTANECAKTFSNCLYKYTDKFIQTDNVMALNNFDEYKEKLKYVCNTTIIGDTLYEFSNGFYSNNFTICDKNIPPDSFNLHDHRCANKYEIKTDYLNSTKYEIFIGLYKFNELTNEYEFIYDSFYDKKKGIYYLYEKLFIQYSK